MASLGLGDPPANPGHGLGVVEEIELALGDHPHRLDFSNEFEHRIEDLDTPLGARLASSCLPLDCVSSSGAPSLHYDF